MHISLLQWIPACGASEASEFIRMNQGVKKCQKELPSIERQNGNERKWCHHAVVALADE